MIKGHVSSPANLYLLADHFGEIVTRSAPTATPSSGWISFHGVAKLTGNDILSQLTAEERDVWPTIFQIHYKDGPIDIGLSDALGEIAMSFAVQISGPDEVRVIGLAEKIGKDVERVVTEIERSPGSAQPMTEATALAVGARPSSAQALPLRTQLDLSKFARNPYAIGILTGLIVWMVTNLPAVATAVSSWWASLITKPWFATGANIAVSVLAGAASAIAVNWSHQRRRTRESRLD